MQDAVGCIEPDISLEASHFDLSRSLITNTQACDDCGMTAVPGTQCLCVESKQAPGAQKLSTLRRQSSLGSISPGRESVTGRPRNGHQGCRLPFQLLFPPAFNSISENIFTCQQSIQLCILSKNNEHQHFHCP